MTRKWSHNSIMGLTDTGTVKLDFDNTLFKTVKYWAFRTMKWFKLEGFIVLKSSKDHYHIVFDRKTSWTDNVRIMAWVSLMSHNGSLVKWFIMQCIKQGSTLRVSPKKEKPCPRVVFRSGSRDSQVAEFLKYRTVVKSIIERMQEKERTETTTGRNKEHIEMQKTKLGEQQTKQGTCLLEESGENRQHRTTKHVEKTIRFNVRIRQTAIRNTAKRTKKELRVMRLSSWIQLGSPYWDDFSSSKKTITEDYK